MPKSGWRQRLNSLPASGTLFNTYTTAKTVLPKPLLTIPSNLFERLGDEATINVRGAISNIVTTPGNIQFLLKFGGVTVWDSGNVPLNTAANTLAPFELDLRVTAQILGDSTTAKLIGIARLLGKCTAAGILMLPDAAPAQGGGFDSSAAQQIDLFVGFSISNAGNGIQIHQFSFDSEN